MAKEEKQGKAKRPKPLLFGKTRKFSANNGGGWLNIPRHIFKALGWKPGVSFLRVELRANERHVTVREATHQERIEDKLTGGGTEVGKI